MYLIMMILVVLLIHYFINIIQVVDSLQFNLNEIYSLKVPKSSIKKHNNNNNKSIVSSPPLDLLNSITSSLSTTTTANDGGNSSSNSNTNYIIGPKHFRRYIDRVSKKKCHELEDARIKHRQLDTRIHELIQSQLLSSSSSSVLSSSASSYKSSNNDHPSSAASKSTRNKHDYIHKVPHDTSSSSTPTATTSSSSLSPSQIQDEIKRLKYEKLHYKDMIVRLMKQQSINQLKPMDGKKNKISLSESTIQQDDSDGDSNNDNGGNNNYDGIIELGVGGYGKVLFGTCLNTQKEIAIKITKPFDSATLWKEYLVLQRLRHELGFPKVYYFGKQDVLTLGENVVMVMEVLGPSLDKLLFSTCLGVRGFQGMTVLRLALQLLSRLESLSHYNIVHGDIQPGNFLLGKNAGDQQTVYLIDFGLSSIPALFGNSSGTSNDVTGVLNNLVDNNKTTTMTTVTSSSATPLSPTLKSAFRGAFENNNNNNPSSSPSSSFSPMTIYGTLSFASSRSLMGQTPRARDDLEALAFTLAYLYQGRLPWSEDSYFHSIQSQLQLQQQQINTPIASAITTGSNLDMNDGIGDDNDGDDGNNNDVAEVAVEVAVEMELIRNVSLTKQSIDPSDLCGVENKYSYVSETIADILRHARQLPLEGKPDFTYLKEIVQTAINHYCISDSSSNSDGNNSVDINGNMKSDNVHRDNKTNTTTNTPTSTAAPTTHYFPSLLKYDWETEGITWSTVDGTITNKFY